MRVGYVHVSIDHQTFNLQRDALKRTKCREIYEEQASGKNTTRSQPEACLKSLRDALPQCRVASMSSHLCEK